MVRAAEFWQKKIDKYRQEDWASLPSIFVQDAVQYFPKNGSLLEVGCGIGNDGVWLKGKDYDVTQLDLEDFRSTNAISVPFVAHDLNKPLEFKSNSFDVVYSHLALHYFTHERTQALFNEIKAILKPGGMLACIVNSTDDPEYGTGKEVETDLYLIGGHLKRFFTAQSAASYCQGMEIIIADNKGATHKDGRIGTSNLVRLVCKKK